MLSAPSPSVRIPVQGVMGWGEVAQSLGTGISSLILGSAALAEEKEQVTATGELADFSRRLHEISSETRAQLAECDLNDWDYSWQKVSAPHFAQAVAELPPAARQAGREFAEAYSRQAAIQALRDRELEQLNRARNSWQQRVEAAVQAGDAEQADRWLQSGAGVFVPQSEMATQSNEVRARAGVVKWRAALADNPVQTLADWSTAAAESLPQEGTAEWQLLQAEAERAKRGAAATLADRLAGQVSNQLPYDDAELELSASAGLITTDQLADTRRSACELKPAELCTWLRRVDELPEDSAELLATKLDILTAPIPQEQRGILLKRMELAAQVAPDDRRTLSRGLWQLYSTGYLGSPGDAMALQRLADLQQSGLPVLAREGSDAAARWMEHVRDSGNRWVCFATTE